MSDEAELEPVVNCEVTIVQTIEPNGQMAYAVRREGNVPLSTYIGLLELGKHLLIESQKDDD